MAGRVSIYVGTSGWSYSWNPDGFDWYAKESGLNAVELNMSFYSFPRESQVRRWAELGASLRWVIKVHRLVTHVKKLSEDSLGILARFRERFQRLEELVDFYLLQLPPSLVHNDRNWRRILNARDAVLGDKTAVEARHLSWFSEEVYSRFKEEGIVFVTPDSPMFMGIPPSGICSSRGVVYN